MRMSSSERLDNYRRSRRSPWLRSAAASGESHRRRRSDEQRSDRISRRWQSRQRLWPGLCERRGGGMYKLDLGAVNTIAQVNTFSALGSRSRQNFVLYGSNGNSDPGWNVADRRLFTPVIEVAAPSTATYQATSIRASSGRPLGDFRWLVWVVVPDHADRVLENSAIQELQVIPAAISRK